jgi:hypothetical protein
VNLRQLGKAGKQPGPGAGRRGQAAGRPLTPVTARQLLAAYSSASGPGAARGADRDSTAVRPVCPSVRHDSDLAAARQRRLPRAPIIMMASPSPIQFWVQLETRTFPLMPFSCRGQFEILKKIEF